ncbi:MAG TPA: hypothetical protein VMR80_07775, partial [Candidatus Acidoferrum sp.]|nr:hypothetical protein [Candidatus Acidoferrum sp.]
MNLRRGLFAHTLSLGLVLVALFVLPGCTKKSSAQSSPANLQADVHTPFRFVAYGDTRFHNPNDTE